MRPYCVCMTKTKSKVPITEHDPIGALLLAGWTVAEVAEECGITPDAIYKLRRDEFVPSPKTSKALARLLGWKVGRVVEHWINRVETAKGIDL